MDTLTARRSLHSQFVPYLRDRVPFKTHGALYGTTEFQGTGRMEHSDSLTILNLRANGHLAYVVYSYATPIAWRNTSGEWYMPPIRYSTTTTKHQNRIAAALSMLEG